MRSGVVCTFSSRSNCIYRIFCRGCWVSCRVY